MIGRERSPVGINPALVTGLNAVFVPPDQTWMLEHQEFEAAIALSSA